MESAGRGERALEVILAAARVIEHVHCHAIVHGNLSIDSSNILLEASQKSRVSGFGASAWTPSDAAPPS